MILVPDGGPAYMRKCQFECADCKLTARSAANKIPVALQEGPKDS